MDRKGKKPKAKRDDGAAHPERSDTKTEARETLGRMAADARLQRERSGGGSPGSAQKGGRRDHRE